MWDAADEEVCVQVEAVGAARALALHVRLAVHAQHGVAPVARHHQLVPAAVLHLHRAGYRARPRACVEPARRGDHRSITKQNTTQTIILALYKCNSTPFIHPSTYPSINPSIKPLEPANQ